MRTSAVVIRLGGRLSIELHREAATGRVWLEQALGRGQSASYPLSDDAIVEAAELLAPVADEITELRDSRKLGVQHGD